MNMEKFFRGVTVLRKALADHDTLKVIRRTRVFTASFVWNDPVSIAAVRIIEKDMGKKLPEDFVVFLTTLSNGAILYRDVHDAMTDIKFIV